MSDNKPAVRILHVDDDEIFLEVSKRVLEAERNYVVDGALSVDEALEKIGQRDYAVIISDYKMPEKNGLDFLKELCLRGNSTPFILFTGKGSAEVEHEVLNLGAFRYFNKSGNPEIVYPALIACIDEAIKDTQVHAHTMENACKELNREDASGELVTLSFARLKRICRFEKDGCCSETKKRCGAQDCPHIQKRE